MEILSRSNHKNQRVTEHQIAVYKGTKEMVYLRLIDSKLIGIVLQCLY